MPAVHRAHSSPAARAAGPWRWCAVGTGAAAEEGERHTVSPGETLGSIAARNHTSVRALAEANGVADADRIIVGQVLVIPSVAGSGDRGAATVVHVVAPGETLSGIARHYGASVAALAVGQRHLGSGPGAHRRPPAGARRLGLVGASGGGAARNHTVSSGETLGRDRRAATACRSAPS